MDDRINLSPGNRKITVFGDNSDHVTISLIMEGIENNTNNIDMFVPNGSFDVNRLVHGRWPINLTAKLKYNNRLMPLELCVVYNLMLLLEKL